MKRLPNLLFLSSILFLLSSLFLAVGCGMSTMAARATVSGGKDMIFMLGQGGPERAKDDRMTINVATTMPSKDAKHLVFTFALTKQPSAPAITSVKVENVSDEVPELLISDAAPQVSSIGVWHSISSERSAGDPHLTWLYHEGNTPRVYRFTVTFADGKTNELYQLDIVPSFLKELIRKQLDMK